MREEADSEPAPKLSKKQRELAKLAARLPPPSASTSTESPFLDEDLSQFVEAEEDPEQGAVDEFEGKVVQAVKVNKEDVVEAAPAAVEGKGKAPVVMEAKKKGKKAAKKGEKGKKEELVEEEEEEQQAVDERVYDRTSPFLPFPPHQS